MMRRTVTRVIPITQLNSGNADEYSETEFTAWDDRRSTIKNEEFGSLAVKILDIITYFDYRFVVPVAIFTEPNSQDALKILADKHLIIFQNDGKEFLIFRPSQVINMKKLKSYHFENDSLESAVQLLEKVINLPEYSNQNSIILTDHAVSVWSYINDCESCESIVRNYANFPSNIMLKLVNDLDARESIVFGEKTTNRLSDVLGANNESTLYMQTLTGASYDLAEDYDKSLSIFNKILIDHKDYSEKFDRIYLTAKYGKASALLETDAKSKEGIDLLNDVMKESKLKLGDSDFLTLVVTWDKINHAFLEEDNVTEAVNLVDEAIPIAMRDDPNSEKTVTLQLRLQKAMLLGAQGKFDASQQLLDEIKSKIVHTDRKSVMEFTFAIASATVNIYNGKLKEARDLLIELKQSAELYLPEDDSVMIELNKFILTIPNSKLKRSVDYQFPMEHFHSGEYVGEQISMPFIYDFKNICLTESQKLIEHVKGNDAFTSKPITSVSISNTFNLLFLIDVFLKKITGNKHSKSIGDSFVPSNYNLNAAVINICDKLENVFFKTLKNPEQFDFAELQSVLRIALEKCSNSQELVNILNGFVQKNMVDAENDADLNELYNLVERVIIDNCDN